MSDKATFDYTLNALAHLVCGDLDYSTGEVEVAKSNQKWHSVDVSNFDGFEVIDAMGDFKEDDPSTYVLNGASADDQPVWPLDVCAASMAISEGWQEGTWTFARVKTLKPADWRGRLKGFSPRMIEVAHRVIEPNGRAVSVKMPYHLLRGRAVPANAMLGGLRIATGAEGYVDPSHYGGKKADPFDEDWATGIAQLAGGLALRRHYLWSVMIGEGDGPRARFVTDPSGVREVFRLRDIPPGKARRAALLHWVRQHWRKRREESANDRSWVREHLRGATGYTWNGLHCCIQPAAADLARIAGGKNA
jgi:hypothetical protein